MARQNLESNFGRLLEDLTREGLRHASTEALVELAKQLWYGQVDLVPVLEDEVSRRLRRVDQKQRALYLVDRLRRFPCVPPDKAEVLKSFVSTWSSLKPAAQSPRATELLAAYRLDSLAYEWGLEEDVSPQMKEVLQYQTRHYAATLGVRTGYSDGTSAPAEGREITAVGLAR
ncbi:hypothetical protein [Pseudomonas nitroreducens]|uniref:hypothetical protein n=1 Tax=Pseudomonas nitroreducens TaxID=46680 RepID=UPI00265AD7B7|nr:hypothetical protein [Pseudomonas nitroreducens]MCP1652256.1 hypothetical protein [Pseudomonas nitroreducens]MCP1689766.1 hypothetical protein [Pseudomonas nitroreducens]